MMHGGNILRYFRGKKRRFSPHKKGALSDTNKQSPREREREREKRETQRLVACCWAFLSSLFLVSSVHLECTFNAQIISEMSDWFLPPGKEKEKTRRETEEEEEKDAQL